MQGNWSLHMLIILLSSQNCGIGIASATQARLIIFQLLSVSADQQSSFLISFFLLKDLFLIPVLWLAGLVTSFLQPNATTSHGDIVKHKNNGAAVIRLLLALWLLWCSIDLHFF